MTSKKQTETYQEEKEDYDDEEASSPMATVAYLLSGSHLTFDFTKSLINDLGLSSQEAVFLNDLIQKRSKTRKFSVKWEGSKELKFFKCTVEDMKNSLREWNKDTQHRILKVLQEMGYVKVTKTGIPACRWVHVDLQRIYTEVAK